MNRHEPICALCGGNQPAVELICGRNGAICRGCVGEALAALGSKRLPAGQAEGLDASRRCLLCDSGAADWRLVAYRAPFVICDGCLESTFNILMESGSESFSAVRF
jgi:hypothetical protein